MHDRAAHRADTFASSWVRLIDSSAVRVDLGRQQPALSSTPSTTSSPAAQHSGGSAESASSTSARPALPDDAEADRALRRDVLGSEGGDVDSPGVGPRLAPADGDPTAWRR